MLRIERVVAAIAPRSGWGWTAVTLAIALLVALPVLFVLGHIVGGSSAVWQHLAATVLGRYVSNTWWLMLGVGSGTLLVGTGTAWLVATCRFPGRALLEWGLLLPLAAPAYILAYAYTDWLDVFGPVQTALREALGWEAGDYWFPNLRSVGGAIAMLTFALYPYVYMLARVAFIEQSTRVLEASRSLGCPPWRAFFSLALPLARPALVAGVSLVLMETLNDFGTVQYFGVDTFTTGIYRTWFGLGDRLAAAQLAAVLLLFVLALLVLERCSRGRARYGARLAVHIPQGFSLRGWHAIAAIAACLLPVGLGFLLPVALLAYAAWSNAGVALDTQFWEAVWRSASLATIAALVVASVAIVLAYGARLQPTRLVRGAVRLASAGYAVPGSTIAVGVLVPLGLVDNALDGWMRATFGISTGLLLSGTVVALLFAYLVRFLAVAFGAVESGLVRIGTTLDNAARSLGCTPWETFGRVHFPLLWRSAVVAATLVFVDTVKELPATAIVRPFNFDTLAVRAYQLAADERFPEASGAALAIALVGIVPTLILGWQSIGLSRHTYSNR